MPIDTPARPTRARTPAPLRSVGRLDRVSVGMADRQHRAGAAAAGESGRECAGSRRDGTGVLFRVVDESVEAPRQPHEVLSVVSVVAAIVPEEERSP